MVNQDGKTTKSHKLAIDTKPSVLNLCVLLCPRVLQKATAHFDTNTLNMCHLSQNYVRDICVGIPRYQKGYLVYVPNTRKIVSSHDIVFDETFSSALSYKIRPYSEVLDMQPTVSYIMYATSSHEQTGDIITFSQCEEDSLV